MAGLKGTESKATRRALNILRVLKGYTLSGLSNGEIAERLNESPVNVSRALALLVDEGFAVKLDNGRFALSIQVLQIATAHSNECNTSIDRIHQLNQRIAAGAL
jgi:putative phage-related DNA-binding protein|nr:MAG TPA: Transcriptional regulator [Caudoviricetes sp.]